MASEILLAALPGCEPACPGCAHRHLSREESEEKKSVFLRKTLYDFGNALAPLHSPDPLQRLGYRRQVSLATQWEVGWQAGMRKKDMVIPIPHCPVHAPFVNEVMARLLPILPPPERFPMVYYVQSGKQLSLVLKTNAMPALEWLEPALVSALEAMGLEGLWLHLHPSAGKRIFGKGGWHLIWGRSRSRDEDELWYGPASFRQLIPSLAARALDYAEDFLQPDASSAVVDLYCGIGASLRVWERHKSACAGVEWSGEALECAAINAPGATLFRGLCHQRIPQLEAWLSSLPQRRQTLMYVNPPRTGLEQEILHWTTTGLRPEKIAYLSCSAGTLKRDLIYLQTAGYEVCRIIPFDFFPQTYHVETLSLLTRR